MSPQPHGGLPGNAIRIGLVQMRVAELDGYACFVVVSQWPASRADILRHLARARAIDNQTLLALCSRTGPAADGTAYDGRGWTGDFRRCSIHLPEYVA